MLEILEIASPIVYIAFLEPVFYKDQQSELIGRFQSIIQEKGRCQELETGKKDIDGFLKEPVPHQFESVQYEHR